MPHSFPSKSQNTWRLLILTSQGPVLTLAKKNHTKNRGQKTTLKLIKRQKQGTKQNKTKAKKKTANKHEKREGKKRKIETKDKRAGQ